MNAIVDDTQWETRNNKKYVRFSPHAMDARAKQDKTRLHNGFLHAIVGLRHAIEVRINILCTGVRDEKKNHRRLSRWESPVYLSRHCMEKKTISKQTFAFAETPANWKWIFPWALSVYPDLRKNQVTFVFCSTDEITRRTFTEEAIHLQSENVLETRVHKSCEQLNPMY